MLENLTREFNPKYDLQRHNFNEESWMKRLFREHVLFVSNAVKSGIRGGLYGGIAGITYECLNNSLTGRHVLNCAIMGAGLDITQYVVRFTYERMKYMVREFGR